MLPLPPAHHLSFLAHVTQDALRIVKLYPEGDAAARFRLGRGGKVYAFCAHHGLFVKAL